MRRLLLLALAILPASLGLAQDGEQPPNQQRPAGDRPASELSYRLIKQAFNGALTPDQLKALGPRATPEQLRDAMTPEQKIDARARLSEAEANAKTPEDLKELARGYLILDENAPQQGESAIRVAARLQEIEPENSEGFALAASGYHQMGDYPAAAQWAEQALKLNPDDERARAVWMLSKGRTKRGAGSAPGLKGTAAGPDGITAAGSDFVIPERHDISPQAIPFVRQAVAARRVGDMTATWNNVQAAMNADPTSKTVQKLYGMAKADQARYAETKEYLRLSGEALDAGRYQEAVALAQRAYERSGNPTVKKILELTQQTADARAQEAAKKDLEAAAAKKSARKGLHPLTTAAMIAGILALAWAATPQDTKDHFKAMLWDNPRQELKYASLAAAIGIAGYVALPYVSAAIASAGPAAPAAPALTPALAGAGAAGSAIPIQQAAVGTLKAALLAGGAWVAAKGSALVSYAKSDKAGAGGDEQTTKRASAGNMQKQVERNQAPKSVDRVDRARRPYEKDQVHFKDGSALNHDGTWKHGNRVLTNAEKEWLTENGWTLPQ